MTVAARHPVAHVVVDIPSRAIDEPFDYAIPEDMDGVGVGSCVLVGFGHRRAVGYVIGTAGSSPHDTLKPVIARLGGPFFGVEAVRVARWIATEYVCALSEAVRLFTPPGGTPSAVRAEGSPGVWTLRRPGVGPVDDRWVELADGAAGYRPSARATLQRAVIDALSEGPVRAAELAADLGGVDGAIRRLETAGVVRVHLRRRVRGQGTAAARSVAREVLTDGQTAALSAIDDARTRPGSVVLLDGVTGSGKTEVYLQAIDSALADGGSACVLVPEISLTPQTVGRFRSRFGDDVAVLHSRLSAGERFDQWDRVRAGDARIVVGARSALFAPLHDLRLIVIDEEHEGSYKQGSAPRYHARDVAVRLAEAHGGVVVLGSASPSIESLVACRTGGWRRVALPERVGGRPLPPVEVVDMAAEFADGHRSMFSRPLVRELQRVFDESAKAVLFLNRRGFASFLLCRECGHVPDCESCATSMTYHEVGRKLACHHCGASRDVPALCPECSSPYLRQFGAGTQRVETDLLALLPDLPVVRMDADTTRGKGAHEKLLAAFEALPSGVLLGTQMIAKGLDYPDVTLVGVISADITLHLPDFRSAERTYQLLEQVAGRAGRGERGGSVIVQTYWPGHAAIRAAAAHDPSLFYTDEEAERVALGYPPFGRLANVLAWGRDKDAVVAAAAALAEAIRASMPREWTVLGPSPCPLERLKGSWRWHVLVKGPPDARLGVVLASALDGTVAPQGVTRTVDIDPLDLL